MRLAREKFPRFVGSGAHASVIVSHACLLRASKCSDVRLSVRSAVSPHSSVPTVRSVRTPTDPSCVRSQMITLFHVAVDAEADLSGFQRVAIEEPVPEIVHWIQDDTVSFCASVPSLSVRSAVKPSQSGPGNHWIQDEICAAGNLCCWPDELSVCAVCSVPSLPGGLCAGPTLRLRLNSLSAHVVSQFSASLKLLPFVLWNDCSMLEWCRNRGTKGG